MSNIAVEDLVKYQKYGESVLQTWELIAQNPPPQESWIPQSLDETMQKVQQAAKRTVELATSPVKIGIMGEFSSGKTLLIGSLIGFADALPVSETPTTGNVTAIHLQQQAELKTTNISDFTVNFLSHSGVRECLRFMLQEVEVRAIAAKISSSLLENLPDLSPKGTVDIKGIGKWCEQVWQQTQSLELRSLLRELVILLRTYHVYGENICDRSYHIDQNTAKKGLRLAEPPMNILELNFDKLPGNPKPWESYEQPSAKDLQNSFSLISRIDITVEVSKEIWDLSGLQGTNEFILLDFPGLGAADSGVRDAYLSLRELQDVQTLLLLLNGRYPGGAIASKIRTMLEKDKGQDLRDRIIVGVGRFNQLPLSLSDQRNLEELLDEPLLSEETVLENLGILQLTIASASNLTTEKKNIVLLSQLHGLSKLNELDSFVKVSSPEFLPELAIPLQSPEVATREKWLQLSQMLPAASSLKKQLSDFAEDGGINRLRALLKNHVAQHGLKQLIADTQTAASQLEKAQQELKILLTDIPNYIPVIENPAFLNLREGIENLVDTYRRFQDDLDKQPILKNRHNLAVSEVVKDELTHKIFFDWSEWTLLLDRTKNGTISLTRSESFFGDEEVEDTIPSCSDDFYSAYIQTISEMQEFAHTRTTEAVTDLFQKLSNEVAKERQQVTEMIVPQIEAQIQENFGKPQLRHFRNLLRAVEPSTKWQKLVIEHSGLSVNTNPMNAKALFPLARKDERHPNGQIFDWSPDKKFPVPPRPFNHQITVLRLRDEITATASLHLVQYVSQLTQQVKLSFSRALKEIVDSLQELLKSKQEPLLRYIAAAEVDNAPIPKWLEGLTQLVNCSSPK
ncbi:dynamin family protein [Calothrix sp. 336/3]|uniref:dynamin family protein n=1 Tax=Calothrix sp. 336/3 TaxID=1337936 RepID=UPI0004E38144|nr:dynamin family protein [Calothrix sp. 336/3]AKG22762.1 dynamin family protein [Calothrix sp. 336/3]